MGHTPNGKPVLAEIIGAWVFALFNSVITFTHTVTLDDMQKIATIATNIIVSIATIITIYRNRIRKSKKQTADTNTPDTSK